MKKLKIVHIHTDYKFVNDTKRFEGNHFLNTSIIIQSKTPYPKKENENVLIFNSDRTDLKRIIEICSSADLVVLYDLTPIKVKIALSLPKNIKIAWRFFGYELYKKRPDLFKSDSSRKYDIKKFNLINSVKNRISPIINFLRYGKTKNEIFKSSITRINYMLCLSHEEYLFIQKIWPDIPNFIKLPHANQGEILEPLDLKMKNNIKKPIIILGNNTSSYNNHLDLIELIDQYKTKVNYEFVLLFNYGTVGNYADIVKKRTKNKMYFNFIEDFIPKNEFLEFYKRPIALVINGYRQMAGFNIFLAFTNGTKVYLNNKNVHKNWLINEGFEVFSIEDFEKDLNNDNLKIDSKSAIHNFENFKQFSKRYTKEEFQSIIYDELSDCY